MRSHFSSAVVLLSLLGASDAAPAAGDLVQVLAAGTTATFKPAYPYTASVCAVTPVAPRNPVFHCGTVGTLRNPDILLGGMITANLRLCADVCQADQECISFGFDSTPKVCTLYRLPLTNMGLKANRQSTVSFYNRHCFACSSQSTGISVIFSPTITGPTGLPTPTSPDLITTATGFQTAPTITSGSVLFTRTLAVPSGTVSGTVVVVVPTPAPTITSATGFQTAPTITSGSVLFTRTVAFPSGTVSGTVVVVVPTSAPTITSATGFQTASTRTSGSVSLTLTVAAPSGTVSGTVVVVVPTPAPTNILGNAGNFTGGLLGGFSQIVTPGAQASFTKLATGQFAYCCKGVALVPLAPTVGGGICTLSRSLNFNILDQFRESFDYSFQNGAIAPVGISDIASPLAAIFVQQVLAANGKYQSVNQTFSTPNVLNSLTFVLTVPFVGNSACITNIKVLDLGPALVIN